MPRMTHEHPFEWKVFEFSTRYSEEQFGDIIYFLLTITSDGKIHHVHASRETPDFTIDLNEGVFEFDPFEWPEYAAIRWSRISQQMMEGLLGTTFDSTDLPMATNGTESFPESWEVVF